jgi:hypothetical protein
MDWASGDYSQVYADTFLSPAPSSGIYIDERSRHGDSRRRGDYRRRGDDRRRDDSRRVNHENERFTSRRGDHAHAIYDVARE